MLYGPGTMATDYYIQKAARGDAEMKRLFHACQKLSCPDKPAGGELLASCSGCGALGDSAYCERCFIFDSAEHNLTRRNRMEEWYTERSWLAHHWPEQFNLRVFHDEERWLYYEGASH